MASRFVGSALIAWGAVLLASGVAAAQEVPEPRAGAAEAPFRASIEYGLTTFTGGGAAPDPWHTVSAELSRKTAPVTLVARTNYAHRFGQDGYQVEADAYPRISRRFYGYLNAGYSPSDIFPELRYGAELYGGFGRGGEASLGARRLEFADEGVTIYTGSLGAYTGNYYLSARPYVTPRDDGTARSGTILVRRYLADGDSHVTFSAGAGTAPTESPLEFELGRTQSYRAALYGRLPLRTGLALRWSAGYEREELTRGQSRDRMGAGIGAETRF
jgi:YaiO family outer membrane protein